MAMDLQQSDVRGLVAAIQAAAGTPTALVPATHGVLAISGQYRYQTDELEREIDRPGHGARPFVNIKRRCNFEFGMELRGHATPGTAAPIGTILRGCGFAQNLVATESAIYSLVNSGHEMLTVDGYEAGSVAHGHDVRGVVTRVEMSIRNFAKAQVTLLGLPPVPPDLPIEDAALPNIVYTAFQAPVPIETETFEVDIDGVKLNAISLMVDTNAQVEIYEGSEARFVHQAQKYRPSGTLRVFKEQRADFNPEDIAGQHLQQPLYAQIVGGGEILRLDLAGVQLGNATPSDEGGIAAWDIPWKAVGTSLTDCLALSFLEIP
jgi:hypothetical protein